jgi:hypothetical protein
LARAASGARALLIDATLIEDPRPGMARQPDGTLLFWGLAKKALGQSLPWLGLLAAVAFLPRREGRRDAYLLCIFAVAIGLAPFVPRAWHGGLGGNMRYFLPLLPLLTALFARLWLDLAERAGGRAHRPACLGALAGVAVVGLHLRFGPGGVPGATQLMSTWMLGAIALAGLAAGLSRSGAAARLGMAAGAAGVAAACIFGLQDLAASQHRRAGLADANAALAQIQPPSLLHGIPEIVTFQIARPDGLMAMGDAISGLPDDALLRRAAARGYAVWLSQPTVAGFLGRNPDHTPGAQIQTSVGAMVEIMPPR